MVFAWTVTFGDVLKLAGILGSALWLTHKFIARLENVEQWKEDMESWRTEHRLCNDKQIQVMNSMANVIAYVQGQMDHDSPRKRR